MTYQINKLYCPVHIGLIGTGMAAKARAQAIKSDSRCQLVAIAGHNFEKTLSLAETYQADAIADWTNLVARDDIDLVIISAINQEHGLMVKTALDHDKHVVVEYPLSLNLDEAQELIAIAKNKQKLLHVEHIELLGSLHQTLKKQIDQIGKVFYARYSTVSPLRPAPKRWTFHPILFGFPLMGAVSRVNRFTDLFGEVIRVSCQNSYWGADQYFDTCLCIAQLQFVNGVMAEICYGKGENLWETQKKFEVHGEKGALIFGEDEGQLIIQDEITTIELGSRKGLFIQDTSLVVSHLLADEPLYIYPETSLYALKVADAARRSAETNMVVELQES